MASAFFVSVVLYSKMNDIFHPSHCAVHDKIVAEHAYLRSLLTNTDYVFGCPKHFFTQWSHHTPPSESTRRYYALCEDEFFNCCAYDAHFCDISQRSFEKARLHRIDFLLSLSYAPDWWAHPLVTERLVYPRGYKMSENDSYRAMIRSYVDTFELWYRRRSPPTSET